MTPEWIARIEASVASQRTEWSQSGCDGPFRPSLSELELAALLQPVPMRLHCPGVVENGKGGQRICGCLHVDKGPFATKRHHTHSCQSCGHTWRPAVAYTVGVQFLPGFKDDDD